MTATQQVSIQALSELELSELAACEAVIERNLAVFYETGQALLRIRDSRLYRATHATFEGYCRERWGFSRIHAHRLIDAAGVAANLLPTGNIPTTERHARELATLEPGEQREVWQAAIETALNGKVTAAHIRETRASLLDTSGEIEPDLSVSEWKFDVGPVPHVANNSGNNEWYTPPEYIEAARTVLGEIALDPASSEIANRIVKATTFYTAADDGLSKAWKGRVWMNPPYAADLVGSFVSKLAEHFRAGDVEQAIVLVNNATETAWFQLLAGSASAICFPKSRVRFLDPEGDPGAPLQGQAILYLGGECTRFREVFAAFGFTVER